MTTQAKQIPYMTLPNLYGVSDHLENVIFEQVPCTVIEDEEDPYYRTTKYYTRVDFLEYETVIRCRRLQSGFDARVMPLIEIVFDYNTIVKNKLKYLITSESGDFRIYDEHNKEIYRSAEPDREGMAELFEVLLVLCLMVSIKRDIPRATIDSRQMK